MLAILARQVSRIRANSHIPTRHLNRAWFSPLSMRCLRPCTPPVRLFSVYSLRVQPSIRQCPPPAPRPPTRSYAVICSIAPRSSCSPRPSCRLFGYGYTVGGSFLLVVKYTRTSDSTRGRMRAICIDIDARARALGSELPTTHDPHHPLAGRPSSL
eukprot:scaffold2108_cov66-Isochrysis_galbana.AAC.1